VLSDTRELVVIKASAAQAFVVKLETKRVNNMQLGPSIGAKADDVASVRRDLGLI
jgi:hypothetical protein